MGDAPERAGTPPDPAGIPKYKKGRAYDHRIEGRSAGPHPDRPRCHGRRLCTGRDGEGSGTGRPDPAGKPPRRGRPRRRRGRAGQGGHRRPGHRGHPLQGQDRGGRAPGQGPAPQARVLGGGGNPPAEAGRGRRPGVHGLHGSYHGRGIPHPGHPGGPGQALPWGTVPGTGPQDRRRGHGEQRGLPARPAPGVRRHGLRLRPPLPGRGEPPRRPPEHRGGGGQGQPAGAGSLGHVQGQRPQLRRPRGGNGLLYGQGRRHRLRRVRGS